MKKGIQIISYILSFVLMLCIVGLVLLSVVKSKVLNEEYVLDVLDKVDYYSKLSKSIEDEFENYYYQSGLEHYVIENLFDENKVKEDSLNVIHSIYTNTEINIDNEFIKEKLRNNIADMLKKENKKLDSSSQNDVDVLVDTIAEVYRSEITIQKEGLQVVGNIINKIENIINVVNYAVLGSLIGLVVIIIILNIKKIIMVFRYYGISLFASGIICYSMDFIVRRLIKVQNLFTLSETLSLVVRYVASNILKTIKNFGIGFIIFGLIFILIHAISKNKSTENE